MNLLFLSLIMILSVSKTNEYDKEIILGAAQVSSYLPLLYGKRVALFSNKSGVVGNQHVLDLLLSLKVNVVLLFSPEHGFRGDASAGELVQNSIDKVTGIPIHSLYGSHSSQLVPETTINKFDIIISDIQDVGLRFYTYYITLIHLMNLCIDYNKQMIIFDRPNPNGFYVDGPILNMKYKSGIGYLPIPIVHGLTLGELANMCNGEGWLKDKKKCNLTVIKLLNYTHKSRYEVPVPPSPNLPNMKSIYLYPSICLFESTKLSLGRGTDFPFQVYGHPNLKEFYDFHFIPQSKPGAMFPVQEGNVCYGRDLRNISDDDIINKGINLEYIIDAFTKLKGDRNFFSKSFELLMGVDYVREMILNNTKADDIKKTWIDDVNKFKVQRKPYLLYDE